MADVEHIREDLQNMMPKYDLIQDILKGELAVKAAKTKYLPVPNNDTDENSERYQAYLKRAVLYNVTSRTLEGLTGQVFLRDPVIELPSILEPVRKDANGSNIDLIQLSKRTTEFTVSYGRCGLFTDYPTVTEASQQDLTEGKIRPTINLYEPWNIVNWKRIKLGSKYVLGLVVLKEFEVVEDPNEEFRVEVIIKYRVLRLKFDGNFEPFVSVTIWQETDGKDFEPISNYILLDGNGESLKEIPFDFIGSRNNDDIIDEPPLYDIASLNIAHYRNSADYEESCFMLGQPTPYLAGLTREWVDDVLKGKVVLGSRAAIVLPEDGSAGLLQVEPNSLAFEAMEHKEKQMMALGAKLVQERRIEATATEVEIQNASEDSVLSTIAKNITRAFTVALERAAAYVNVKEEIKFELNTNFDLITMTADETRILAELWANFNAVTTSEMREGLRRSGLARLPDDEYESIVVTDKQLKDKLGINENDTQANADNRSIGATN